MRLMTRILNSLEIVEVFEKKILVKNVLLKLPLLIQTFFIFYGSDHDFFFSCFTFDILIENNLKAILVDIFGGNLETANYTLTYMFLYVGHHPDVKKKIVQEINRVIGPNRSPSWADRPKLVK